jgi:hypothetical protein
LPAGVFSTAACPYGNRHRRPLPPWHRPVVWPACRRHGGSFRIFRRWPSHGGSAGIYRREYPSRWRRRRVFLVTPAAGLWPAFLVRSGQLTVAGDAIDMVGVCHRLSVRIGQSFELGRQASLFIGHVAGTAVPIDFCQRLGVAAVEKSHRRPFQRPHGLHGVDDDQVRTALKGPVKQPVPLSRPLRQTEK